MIFNRFSLTALREAQQVTRSELAKKADKAPSYITQLEKGDRNNPSITALREIAEAIDADPRAFYVDVGIDRLMDELVEKIDGDHAAIDVAIELLTKLRDTHK